MVRCKRRESSYAQANNYQAGQDSENARLAEQNEEEQNSYERKHMLSFGNFRLLHVKH